MGVVCGGGEIEQRAQHRGSGAVASAKARHERRHSEPPEFLLQAAHDLHKSPTFLPLSIQVQHMQTTRRAFESCLLPAALCKSDLPYCAAVEYMRHPAAGCTPAPSSAAALLRCCS